ncbi:MAG: MFS transporter [Solirubrobacterales bacterium]|nr:MFS transporter [Solirubrobacterales bacterium]
MNPLAAAGRGFDRTFAALFAVTLLVLLSIGATLPVLPQYVKGPVGSTDLAVGVVTGAYAITGLAFRPLAGSFADQRGRRPVVIAGTIVTVVASLLYFLPFGVVGLVVARLILGAGEGVVYTASSAWVVDITDPRRRGRIIGLYGLAIWGGLSFGPPIGDALHRAVGYGAVWAFAAAAPLVAAAIAVRIPEPPRPAVVAAPTRNRLFAREALGPGLAMTMATLGYAALAGFIVLHLDARGIDHGASIFTAFALTVVAARVLFGWLPDRFGGVRCAIGAGLLEAAGLLTIALADDLAVALAGAIAVGGAFSLIFPSLVLLVMDRVPPQRRGIAMGTFTACFDLGVGIGAPIAGAAAALGGYGSSFVVAALAAAGASALALTVGRRHRPLAAALPAGAALCLAGFVLMPGQARAADPDCLATTVPAVTRPAEPLRFGITPLAAGSAGASQDAPVPEDRARAIEELRELVPAHRPLVVRLNRMFWSDGTAGIHRYARITDRFAAAGFDVELQVRYHPPEGRAGDMGAWKRYVRRAARILGRRPSVTALTITNEANFDVSPNTSDGSYPGVRKAIVRGILAARHELNSIGREDVELGFSFAWRWLPSSDRRFWEVLGRRSTPRFRRALDYVGLQIYPGLVVPSAIAPGSSAGEATVEALTLLRRCYLPKAGIGRRTDLWVTENGYVTNLGRTERAQRHALASTVEDVHRWSGTLGVTDYRWFNLRDNVSGGPGLFDSVGLLRDDYSRKAAFGAFRRAIRAHGSPSGP